MLGVHHCHHTRVILQTKSRARVKSQPGFVYLGIFGDFLYLCLFGLGCKPREERVQPLSIDSDLPC